MAFANTAIENAQEYCCTYAELVGKWFSLDWRRDVAFFKLAGDESGSDRVFVVGAYINTLERWGELEVHWNKVHGDVGMPMTENGRRESFHMADFENRVPPYSDWTDDRRIKCISQLIRVINESNPTAIVYRIPIALLDSEFDRRFSFPSEKLKQTNRYMLCFSFIYLECVARLVNRKHERMPLFFDRHQTYSKMALAVYEELEKRNPDISRVIGPLAFENKEFCIPIQAADILAYEMMKDLDNGILQNGKTRRSFQALNKSLYSVNDFGQQTCAQVTKTLDNFLLKDPL